jgi:hypothetical protein
VRAASAVSGFISFWPQSGLSMFAFRTVRRNQLKVLKSVSTSLAFSHDNQILFPKPEEVPHISSATIRPALDGDVIRVIDDSPRPPDPLAPSQIWCPVAFVFAFRNAVPEPCFLAVVYRVAPTPHPPPQEAWLRLDEVTMKNSKHLVDVTLPVTVEAL